MAVIAARTEVVGIGDLTFGLVHGEPVPDGLPDDVVATLVANQQAVDDGVEVVDPYSQEARDGTPAEPEAPAEPVTAVGGV